MKLSISARRTDTACRRSAVLLTLLLLLLSGLLMLPLSAACNHVYTDWEIIEEPYIYNDELCPGQKMRSCTRCGETFIEDVPYTHTCTADGIWQTTATAHWQTCSLCKADMLAADHSFGDWVMEVEPTPTSVGTKSRTCTVCGYIALQSIPRTEDDSAETETPVTEVPETDAPPAASDPAPSVPDTPSDLPVSPDPKPAGSASAPTADKLPFIDISADDPYYEAVRFVYEHALFVGIETADGLTFAPDMTMSRAMFVTVLGRLAEIDPAAYSKPSRFTDVVNSAWYAPYVAWAESSGIVLGYDTGAFGIGDEISVEQAAVIMARFAKADGLTVFDASYKNVLYADAAQVSDWAAADVGWCLYTGIHAPENGRIEPKNDASRALVAQMLYRYSAAFRTN